MEAIRTTQTFLSRPNATLTGVLAVCRRATAAPSIHQRQPLRPPPARIPTITHRCLSTTPSPCGRAKQAKDARGKRDTDRAAQVSRGDRAPDPVDQPPESPFDMSDVDEAFAKASPRFEDELKALGRGSRFNADAIGKIPVTFSKKQGGATVPLEETALVDVRQGRIVQLTLFEPEHRKAVMSAIQASDAFNQQPQPDPDDPAVLTLKVEAEKLDDQLRSAKDVAHRWREALRKVTAARQKRHTLWKSKKFVSVDERVKLDKDLQKLQDAKMKVIDQAEERVLQTLRKFHANTLPFE